MRNKVNKTIQSGRPQYWYYWWDWFMKTSFGMVHENWFGHSGFIEIITSTIRVLLTGRLYDVCHWDSLRWHDIYIYIYIYIKPSFTKIGRGVQTIKGLPQKFERLQCWYYWWKGSMKCATEMGSGGMAYLPTFMKTGRGVKVILRFCLSILKGCNVGTTDGEDLWCTPLKRVQVAWYIYTKFHDDQLRHLSNITDTAATIWGCNVGITDRRNL
jgi:hypothetical protein